VLCVNPHPFACVLSLQLRFTFGFFAMLITSRCGSLPTYQFYAIDIAGSRFSPLGFGVPFSNLLCRCSRNPKKILGMDGRLLQYQLILPVRTVYMLRRNKAVLHGPASLIRIFFHLCHAYVYQRLGVSGSCDCVRKTFSYDILRDIFRISCVIDSSVYWDNSEKVMVILNIS
jgi:hypothetical protein